MACVCGNEKQTLEAYYEPLKKVLGAYPKDERYLIPILQDAQEKYGYLPRTFCRVLPTASAFL